MRLRSARLQSAGERCAGTKNDLSQQLVPIEAIPVLFYRRAVAQRFAALTATLIATAKLNDIDPPAWLADVLAAINDHAIYRLDQLLPRN